LGRITFDDVIDVVEAEVTEDLLKFGGVPGDEQLGAEWHQAIRSRLPWLYVNLVTASLSGAVVWLFRDVITSAWVLAALVPVVAGMGGNAGTQALAVTVRRVSLGLIPRDGARSVVAKEFVVGGINGFMVGSVVGAVAWLVGGHWTFGMVVILAMWGNLIVAGVAGSSIPLLLEKVGVDPAVASSVFVTAFTDVCGYFLLLSLASALILT
jgi:magnesium transporter